MEDPIAPHRDALRALCLEYGVARLELFGSATRDDFDPARSDLDFLVRFSPLTPGERAEAYFGLLAALEDLFGRSIDLVEESAIENPYVRHTIERHRRTVYAAA